MFVEKSCCPTLIILSVGPYMAIFGGVLTERFIVQPLTDMLWVGHSSTHAEPRIHRLARVLVALKTTLHRLARHYKNVISDTTIPTFNISKPQARNFPYPTSFTDSANSQVVRFQYLETLEDDPTTVTYKAKIVNVQNPGTALANSQCSDIVVKFSSTYGKEVHELLSAEGHAPTLRYCGPPLDEDVADILGVPFPPSSGPSSRVAANALPLCSMMMIVMDYVEPKPWPSNAILQIQDVITGLHAKGYVFGDLRTPNVLFDRHGKVKLIDFDWSGTYSRETPDIVPPTVFQIESKYARYPVHLSPTIKWPQGAGECLAIRPEHDIEMLKNMQTELLV